ncbi:helix-turn-helix domain-containing protein [Planococcus shixiaomingii]|uniref:helix-turn-helix domain-containing protein n=1 Tax=Planococcus shixiaomingii TaxID=3058393 RepID=UPI0026185034|nr:helix-turn-helix transcriptional regulator [Planococcus sp. N022]WKA56814.1 helix-turn-helix transcriptional regulator [Planococcus sp. N022]
MTNTKLPYNQDYHLDYRFLKLVRIQRNLTLKNMSEYMGVDVPTLSRLERQELQWTPLYASRFKDACSRIRLSNMEVASLRRVIELREARGLK